MPQKPVRISLTTGDPDGIGTEVTGKALQKLKPKKGVHFFLWRSPGCPRKHLRSIDSQFNRIEVKSWPEALRISNLTYKNIVDINSPLPPAKWVELSAKASMFGHIDAISTAPLSKTSIKKSGYNSIGHTEMLQKLTKSEDLFMTFLGKKFNVLLMTGHIGISNVGKKLTETRVENSILAAHHLTKVLPQKIKNRPIAVLGANPHAGEEGLIGNQEVDVIQPAIAKLKKRKISIVGPLVPDSAFFEENWKKYSIFVCPYHDQGLIPFKMIHGQENGVHITFGLPFIRTSVDHGTAKKIFGKNKANPNSMIEAIEMAVALAKSSTRLQI